MINKKPTPAQLEVLKEMNEGFYLVESSRYNKRIYLLNIETKLTKGLSDSLNNINYSFPILCELLKNDLIDISKDIKERFFDYYVITERGKQALNEQEKTN